MNLPYSTISILLFLFGAFLLGAEAFVPGGILGVIGSGLIAGAIAALFFPQNYWMAFWVAFALVASISAVFLVALYKQMRGAPRKEVMSQAKLLNAEGVVVETVDPGGMTGKVQIGGDIWSAQSDDVLPPGTKVIVLKLEGVRAIVRKAE